ncbi:hypothetical protein [Pseudonocardia sp. GCM10023141]|uniref:hypothetical protein n=1 Tax=Pseudonocardia sp. GCM10023141 TaxID=3252653 RepID=UPI00360F93DF
MVITARRTSPVLPVLAGAWSIVTAALGGWWWWRPDRVPFGRDPQAVSGPLDWLPAGSVGPGLVAAGAFGLLLAVLARTGRRPAPTAASGAVFALVFGVVLPGMQPVMFAGYLVAMLGPVVVFLTVLAGAWRWRGGPAVVAAFVLIAVLAWTTGFADAAVFRRYGEVLVGAAAKLEQPAYLTFLLACGVLFAVIGARAWLAARGGRPAPAWTRPEAAARWGRAATVVAMLCALPYGLVRMTWLTPWPVGPDAATLAATPEIRLHGLLLGLAALGGAVLTAGLVARWGEVWPRWIPVLRGRPVPVAAAVVPGALVATLFACASLPFGAQVVATDEAWMLLLFPFPLWALSLGGAVLAYALRRRRPQAPSTTWDNG